MRTPQIARLLVSPSSVFAEHADNHDHAWLDVLAALAIPTAVVSASFAFSYADALLVGHFAGNFLLLTASFGLQSFAATFVGRLLYQRAARATLVPFALTLVAHEVFLVGIFAVALVASAPPPAFVLVLALACSMWNLVLTYALFRSFGGARLRAVLGVVLHFATIAALVGVYMHAQDLLPYPPGRP